MSKNSLTKEAISRLFPDNFQLAAHAIHIAQDQIHAGNEELNVTDLLEHIRKQAEKEKEEERKAGEE